ncbi:MAG: hypothetical protein SNG38_03890 [Rikenellaceae bacterium]
MKEISIKSDIELRGDNVRKYFAFFNMISNVKGDLLLNFSKVSRKNEIPNSYKMLISAFIEKNKLNLRVTGLSVEDSRFEAVHPRKIDNWGDDWNFSEIQPHVISGIMQGLKRIGININNPRFSEKYERAEALLTEIVANATEHGIQSRNINYWITCDVDTKNKVAHFAFVDLGIGIAGSHREAGIGLWGFLKSDCRVVKDSFEGLIPSSTKNPDRGKGLPEIYRIVKNGYVDDFIVVSNRAAMIYNESIGLQTLSISNFHGTYYKWTVKNN